MNAQQLKNAILQEAIEGRLVPQDPNDEPASALLARIRQEKEKLYKDGLLKKKEITDRDIIEDEVPFIIPKGWVWTKIDNVAFVTKLAGFEYTKYIADNLVSREKGVPLFKGKNVQNGKIIYEFEAYIPLETSNDLKRSQINKKCLLTPYVGTIGNIGIHDKVGVYHLGSNVGKIEFYNGDNTNILEEYAKYYLMSSYGYDELTKYKKATAQESISIEAIRDVFIPLPPIDEQHRIVAKIEELLPKVEEYGKAQDALNKLNTELPERLKKSILQEAIEGRLVPQDPNDEPASVLLDKIRKEKAQLVKAGKLKKKDLVETPIPEDEIPFEIPDSWEWVRWGELGEYKKGPFGSSLTKSMFVPQSDKAVKVYEQKNAIQKNYSLGDYYITKEKYETMTGFTVHPGDIIVSCAGTIGETYLLPPEAPIGIINQALMRAKLHLDSIIPYWLLHFQYILLIENKLKGSGSAIKNIPPFEVLKAMPVPLPPLAEQHRIVEKLEQLLDEIDKLK